MAKDTADPEAEPTSLQTGVTSSPFGSAENFSGSDDEILDNFADGPDPNDDGVPLGVGGEKGKQSEPASSTLEADLVSGDTKQSGEELPSDYSAGGKEPVQEPAGETDSEDIPESTSEEPEAPEISPMLLRMAGYADLETAKADGLGTPELLNAFIHGRGQRLNQQPADTGPRQSPYGQPQRETPPPPPPASETEAPGEFKPFELSEDDQAILDDHLQDTILRMNAHNQQQFEAQQRELQALRSSMSQSVEQSESQRLEQELTEFDQAVQGLGDDWKDLFGEGDIETLVTRGQADPASRLSAEYRRELWEATQAIREANADGRLGQMDVQGEIGFALRSKFPEKFQQIYSGNSSQRSNGSTRRTSLNRPTQRKSPEARQDPLLTSLSKKYPRAGFTAEEEDGFDGEI